MQLKSYSVSAQTDSVLYATKITSRDHSLVSDEPIEQGGGNAGMRPHELLLAALASCTCITIKMYAERKLWKLKHINAELVMERTVDSGIHTTKVIQELFFDGDLDETMKNRLVEIASHCPVHKTLAPTITIETRLKQ